MEPELETHEILKLIAKWEISLVDGGKFFLWANGYSEEGNEYVFDVVGMGTPNYLIDVARIPTELVSEIFTVIQRDDDDEPAPGFDE